MDARRTELKAGRYTLLRVLGEGSQGATYEGRDNGVEAARPAPEKLAEDFAKYVQRARVGETPVARGLVAIKCFRVDRAKAWKDVELAEREARTLASLDHPRLPRYIEHFEEDGALYLVMEKIEGESLASLRAKGRTLAPGEVTRMIEQVGEALVYLHGRAPPVVHRDIKPGNVIRRHDGSFALVDFGAVRDRLKPGGGSTVVGTFGYMAPEQFQGRASSASDVYGLGATALTMLTGVEPEDLPHRGLGIDVDAAVPAGTPAALVRALRAMLVVDPDARVKGMGAVLETLRGGEERAAERRPERAREREPRRERRDERARERDAWREARRQRREARRARRLAAVPALPRALAKLGIALAMLAVWIGVGMVVPLVLHVLALFFGEPLRRAARACVAAAGRATEAMGRASRRLSGIVEDDVASAAPEEAARVRIDPEAAPRRVADAEERDDEEDDLADEQQTRRRRR